MVEGQRLSQVLTAFKRLPTFCSESLQIRNKRGRNVAMALGPAGVRLADAIAEADRLQKAFRAMYLKARQVWISATFEAFVFSILAFERGQKARVVAHNGDSASLVYEYFQQYAANYRPFRGVVGMAGVVNDADGHMLFDNGSEVRVSTAGTVEAGRGGSIRINHKSEVAFWRNAEKLAAGMGNSMPDDPGTYDLEESTANGASGYFYERWNDQTNGLVKLFFGWHEHPEYYRAIGDVRYFQDSLTKTELALMQNFRCTLEQIAWRREKIRTTCAGSEKLFHQEYPSTPEEAFLHSGRPRFDLISIGLQPRREAAWRGELVETEDGRILRQENDEGSVYIWRERIRGCRYVAGVDNCEGIDVAAVGGKTQPGKQDPDYGVVAVGNADSGEVVAMIRGRLEPAELARQTRLLGKLYGTPFVVPEANGPGLAYLQALQTIEQYPMSRVYHRDPEPDEILASGNEQLLQKLGWRSSIRTRPVLIANLATALTDGSLIIHDPTMLAELRAFVIKPNGKAEANEGSHDDCVIAIALMLEGILVLPPEKPRVAADPRPSRNGRDGVTKYGGGTAARQKRELMSLQELRRRAG